MAIAYLTHERFLSPEEGELLGKLRGWRNRVAHGIEAVDPQVATAYCDLAETMLRKFRNGPNWTATGLRVEANQLTKQACPT